MSANINGYITTDTDDDDHFVTTFDWLRPCSHSDYDPFVNAATARFALELRRHLNSPTR